MPCHRRRFRMLCHGRRTQLFHRRGTQLVVMMQYCINRFRKQCRSRRTQLRHMDAANGMHTDITSRTA